MIKIFLITFFIFLFGNSILAQGEYDHCYFGTAGLDLGGFSPFVLTNSGMGAKETAASVCDSQGNLLFYSNGGNSPLAPGFVGAVWNANHQIMDNGLLNDSSGCISSFQGAIAIPSPNNLDQNKTGSNDYYLITRDCVESSASTPYYNSGLTYSIIDMNANNGLGKVVHKNQVVVPFSDGGSIKTSHEPVTAIRNQNNISWWVFSYNNDSLYNIELTNNGFSNYSSYDLSEGEITVSPRRDKLISGDKLYDFDPTTGQLNYLTVIDNKSASFSPDGTKLYTLFNNKIFQYDIDANNIENSMVELSTVTGIDRIYLAPDGRIYLFRINVNNIPGYIECPNKNSSNVSVIMNSIYLGGKESGTGFTNIPACYLYDTTSQCNVAVHEFKRDIPNVMINPNPSTKTIVIFNNTKDKIKKVEIINSRGQLCDFITNNFESQINLSQLNSGVYFVHLIFNKRTITKKLIIK